MFRFHNYPLRQNYRIKTVNKWPNNNNNHIINIIIKISKKHQKPNLPTFIVCAIFTRTLAMLSLVHLSHETRRRLYLGPSIK